MGRGASVDRGGGLAYARQHLSVGHLISGIHRNIGDRAPDGSRYRHFHFHGFEHYDSIARFYAVADLGKIADYFPRHLGLHGCAPISLGCRRGSRPIGRWIQADLEAAAINGGRVAINGYGIARPSTVIA